MPKLAAIGDSLTQGFMHGAACMPEWSYPAMVARALECPFRVPSVGPAELGGLPLNLEQLARALGSAVGPALERFELPLAAARAWRFGTKLEGWWEVGPGIEPAGTGPLLHNLAITGVEPLDSYWLTARMCQDEIPPPRRDFFDAPLPSQPMYRTAVRTLNPERDPDGWEATQLTQLERLAREEGPVENLILYLGPNCAIGTTISLSVVESVPSDLEAMPGERTGSLMRPEEFTASYGEMAGRVRALQDKGLVRRVFVGTIPPAHVGPITRGVNAAGRPAGADASGYFDYYTRFWVWDDDFRENPELYPYLTRDDIARISARVAWMNGHIRQVAAAHGWSVVDVGGIFEGLRYRSTGGMPSYRFPRALLEALERNPATAYLRDPEACRRLGRDPAHPLDIRFFQVEGKEIVKGGIAGLDGVHPTTIGYGLIADEFLRAMSEGGSEDLTARLDWDAIVAADTLVTDPPALLGDFRRWLRLTSKLQLVGHALSQLGRARPSAKP